MGLNVLVYKFPLAECTRGGISSKAMDLCLVNVDGPDSPNDACPAAMLVSGHGRGQVRIVPAIMDDMKRYWPEPRWVMMGGNFAHTSDSRFHDAVSRITGAPSYGAVPIHDRIES